MMIHGRSSATMQKARPAVDIWSDNGIFSPDKYSSGIDIYFLLLTEQLIVGLSRR